MSRAQWHSMLTPVYLWTHVWVLLRDELSFPSHPLNIPFVIQQPDFQVINQITVLLCLKTFYGFPLDAVVNKTPLVRAYKTPPKQLLSASPAPSCASFPFALFVSATGPSFLSSDQLSCASQTYRQHKSRKCTVSSELGAEFYWISIWPCKKSSKNVLFFFFLKLSLK